MIANEPNDDVLIRLEDVGKTFQMGEVAVNVLRHISLEVLRRELLVMVGPSGSGKTTILNIMGGLDSATVGKFWYHGRDMTQATPRELTRFRRDSIGFVFQFYNLVPNLTARENVLVSTEISSNPLDVDEVLAMVGLAERKHHFPSQLSGGEQQRVAIARALAKNPELLLCDEPTAALDFETGKMVLRLLVDLKNQLGKTILVITHNTAIGAAADRVVHLRSGEIQSVEVNEAPQPPEEITLVKVLDHKLLREVRGSVSLLLAITSIIAVGVMCWVYMRSAHHNLNLAKSQYYAQCRMADFWIEVKKVPLAELAAVAELSGVTEIRPRIQFFATVDLEQSEALLNGMVLSLPDRREPVINDILVKRGGYFTDRRDNEVIVNEAFAKRHGIVPGQWIHLLLNNRRQELFVVGTAISCEFVYLVGPGAITPDPEHFGVFYLKRTYAEEVFDFAGAANQIVGQLAPSIREQPEDVLQKIETLLAPYGVFTTTARSNQSSNRFLSDEIRGIGVFASIMPVIFMAVAAMVLNVLMLRLTEQQRTVIGTLKAIGYADSQIFWHFTKFGMILGLCGGMVGLVMGYFMANFVTSLYKMFYEFPDLHNQIYPGTYLGGLAISLGCALVGSVQGARTALRLSPAEAMRPRPPAQGGAIWLEKFGWFWRQLSFGWRLVLRNIFRNKLRTTVGMFAAAMGAALLMCGFMLSGALNYLITFQFENVTHSDLDLSFQDERSLSALFEAADLPNVDRAEPLFDVACTFSNGSHRKRGGITGVAPDARLTTPRDLQAQRIRVPTNGLAMSRKMAQILHIRAGDDVLVTPVKGRRAEIRAPVVVISDGYIGVAVYADIHYLSRLVGEELALTGAQLMINPEPKARRELYRELKRLPALQAVDARADVIKNLNFVVETQRIFIGFLVIFAGVIFFSSLLNTSLVSLAERRREVATLRVLGYSEWQVGGLFLRESIVVTAMGTLFGLPLGYSLAMLLSVVYDTEMFRFPLISPPSVWITTIVMASMFALAAHLMVQRNVNRLDWLEASKTKE